MPKHRFRKSLKSFFGNHFDQEKDEQLKGSKIEIDDKVTQILKLIKDEENGSKKESLVQLIKDFNKHYQSLYAQYDHITGELKKKVRGKREKDDSSSSSDSDSDYPSNDGGSKNGQLESKFQDIADSIKQELEAANLEIADLKSKLSATSEEKDALNSNYLASLSKLQEADEIINNLKLESEISESEKSQLLVDNEELRHKLDTAAKIEAEVNQRLENLIGENDNLILEKETVIKRIEDGEKFTEDLTREVDQLKQEHITVKQELDSVMGKVSYTQQQLESAEHQVRELSHSLNVTLQDNEFLNSKLSEALNEVEQAQGNIQQLMAELSQSKEEQGERERDLLTLKELHEVHGNESSAQIKELEAHVKSLELELESLHSQKAELKLQLEREKQESSESLNEMEKQKSELESQINNHERMLKEQEDAFNKLSEEYKQLETSFQDCKALIEIAERKMQEMAGEHEKSVQSKDQILADLEEIIEDLKRDLEMKGDEISSFVDNVRNIEVKLRLSNQKLRVTEQLLTEKEEGFRKAEAKFLEEQSMLEERVTTLSGIITANEEAYRRIISDISKNVNSTLTGFEAVIQKFEESYSKYEHCVKETSKELKIAKQWVEETKGAKKQLTNEMTNLIEQLKDQKEQESMLRENVEKLQIKANKEELEKENKLQSVKQLENKVEFLERSVKEKDQGILGLGEEKREAIRQLCIWIDYHRSRCDDLKEILSKSGRVQRAT